MVENQKVSSNRQTPRGELTREKRMRRLQRRRAISITVFTLTAIAILIAMILVIK